MRKFARVASIVSLVLTFFTLLLAALVTLLQHPLYLLLSGWFNPSAAYYAKYLTFQFPFVLFTQGILLFIIAAIMSLTSGSAKVGIWTDIVCLVSIFLVLPICVDVVSAVETDFVYFSMGEVYSAQTLSYISTVRALFSNISYSLPHNLLLLSIGVSLAVKRLTKKPFSSQPAQEEYDPVLPQTEEISN